MNFEKGEHKKILLNEGITNTSYLIDNKYVERVINKEIFRDPYNKPINEKRIIEAIRNEEFVENVISYNENTGEKISIFIDNTKRLSEEVSKEELELVGNVIKKLHSICIPELDEFEPFTRLDYYISHTPNEQRINSQYVVDLIKKVKKLYEKYPLITCHNDIVRGNMLFKENKIYLLDYEYAGKNIALFDLASFISENNIDNKEKIKYFLSLFDANIEEFNLMVNFLDVLWYYWARCYYIKRNEDIFTLIAEEKLKRIENNIQ